MLTGYRCYAECGPARSVYPLEYTNISAGYSQGQRPLSDGDSTQISQEFQLSGDFMSGSLRYTAGLFYMQDETDTGVRESFFGEQGIWGSVAPSVPFGFVAALVNYEQAAQENDSTIYAAYTQWSWNATDNLELTAGLRNGFE